MIKRQYLRQHILRPAGISKRRNALIEYARKSDGIQNPVFPYESGKVIDAAEAGERERERLFAGRLIAPWDVGTTQVGEGEIWQSAGAGSGLVEESLINPGQDTSSAWFQSALFVSFFAFNAAYNR